MTGQALTEPTSVSTLALPRCAALTDALLATGPSACDDRAIAQLRERLEHGLARVANRPCIPHGVRVVRIGLYQLSRIASGPCASGTELSPPAFRWSARTARRAIGLAAVRAGLDGRAATPLDAVALVVSDPAGPFGVGRSGPGSCADWLASLAAPARAAVGAEATTWATQLWTALDWHRLGPPTQVGPADRGWHWAGAVRVALRGRVDVRLAGGACLTLLDGLPNAGSRSALKLSALVDALAKGAGHVPDRVIGWWPDCGKAWIVPIDAPALGETADAVVRSAGVLLGAAEDGDGSTGR